MPCHNEEKNLGAALERLLTQTVEPSPRDILVICDRCTDRTAEIARNFGARVIVKNWTKYAPNSIFTKPLRIAETLNVGLRVLDRGAKYVMTFSPDGYISDGYIEEALGILESNPSVGIAGHAKADVPTYVRGMGMVIRRSYIDTKFGGLFPETPAQDTYFSLKTLEEKEGIVRLTRNYLVHSRDMWGVKDTLLRAHDMARLGYTFVFAVGVPLRARKPHLAIIIALAFIIFYFTKKKLSTQPFLSAWQKQRMKRWIRNEKSQLS